MTSHWIRWIETAVVTVIRVSRSQAMVEPTEENETILRHENTLHAASLL